jgi:hypothetical protein
MNRKKKGAINGERTEMKKKMAWTRERMNSRSGNYGPWREKLSKKKTRR